MKFICVPLLLLSALVTITVHAQTADEIVNKTIEAVGGKDKLNGIKTLYFESDIDVMGSQASSTTYIVNGKGYKSEVDFGGQKIINCVTDKSGWTINPMAGQTAPVAYPEEQVKMSQLQLQVGGPLFDYVAKGNKVELAGQEDVAGVKAHKLKVTSKEGVEINYWIDPATFYVLKTVSKAKVKDQTMETTVNFSNYQKTDYGYVVPFTTETILPQGITLNITHKKAEVNKDIDMTIFDMPKQ